VDVNFHHKAAAVSPTYWNSAHISEAGQLNFAPNSQLCSERLPLRGPRAVEEGRGGFGVAGGAQAGAGAPGRHGAVGRTRCR